MLPLDQTVAYYGRNGDGIQVPFNFELLTAEWNARGLADFIDRYLAAMLLPTLPGARRSGVGTDAAPAAAGVAPARVPAFVTDGYRPVQADGDVLADLRSNGEQDWLVALNLGPDPARLAPPGVRLIGRVELSTHPDRDGAEVDGELILRGNEGLALPLPVVSRAAPGWGSRRRESGPGRRSAAAQARC